MTLTNERPVLDHIDIVAYLDGNNQKLEFYSYNAQTSSFNELNN